MTAFVALLALSLAFAPAAGAVTHGVVDRSYATNGTAFVQTGSFANDAALAPDGRVVVVSSDGLQIVVTRFLVDGRVDPTFGVNGSVRPYYAVLNPMPTAIAVQPDGRIVLVVYTTAYAADSFSVMRLLPNGRYDPSFHGTGISAPIAGVAYGVALDSAGRIVVPGSALRLGAVWRLTPNGLLDATFGKNGKANASLAAPASTYSAVVDVHDRIVTVGTSPSGAFIERFLPSGNRDRTFGSSGVDYVNELSSLTAVAVAPDGDIYSIGHSGALHMTVVQVGETGARNTMFGRNGVLSIAGVSGDAIDLALRADGSVIVAGLGYPVVTTEQGALTAIVHVLPNGHVDPTFACNGVLWTRFGIKASWFGNTTTSILLAGDKAFLVGSASGSIPSIAVQRIALDSTGQHAGYWLATADGYVDAFGGAASCGSLAYTSFGSTSVGLARDASGRGYWIANSDGGVFTFGDAQFSGSAGGIHLAQPVVGMASTPTGHGYWLVARDGGVFSFGDARFFGSTGGIRLAQPVVGMASTPTGHGYWLVAADGGVFSFGDARFFGSTGGIRLAQPVVGMASTSTGHGYWLVARDGGVFSFGDARFHGSTGSIRLAQPVAAMATTPTGGGYWLVATDGGVFSFGDARFEGSDAIVPSTAPFMAIVSAG